MLILGVILWLALMTFKWALVAGGAALSEPRSGE